MVGSSRPSTIRTERKRSSPRSRGWGCRGAEPADVGREPILAVHADHYVAFRAEAYARFRQLPNHGPEVLPNVHPYIGADAFRAGAEGRAPRGSSVAPAGISATCPARRRRNLRAAYASAQTAIAGGRSDPRAASARPSPYAGHPAITPMPTAPPASAISTTPPSPPRCCAKLPRVAIVDFDTHHGDGTQAIFYARDDVFYGSVHTDPSAYYPHFAGYADETGAGAGDGDNLNLPLAQGAGDDAFLDANRALADAVTRFGAEALVISAGWDAHATTRCRS